MLNIRNTFRIFALWCALLLILAGCGGGAASDSNAPPTGTATGTITGRVADAQTGLALPDVTVQIAARATRTDANGNYTLESVPTGNNLVARFTKDQYASTFATLDVASGQNSVADRRLTKIATQQEMDADLGGVVSVAGASAQVEFPAASLVNAATGAAVSGRVTVAVTPIDPGISPLNMPGGYRAQGESVPIESLGALQVEIRDAQGTQLNLASGKRATVRIPVASGARSPALTMPLYYFNESTGLWVREGSATLAGTAPRQYYEGQVSHFTVWNVDQPMDTVYIHGCVRTHSGPVAGAYVSSVGLNYFGSASVYTDADGNFRVPARRDSQVSVKAQYTAHSDSVVVSTGSGDLTLSACLVPAQNPPLFVTQPQDLTVAPDGLAWLEALANHATQYQWFRNGQPVASGSRMLLISSAGNGAGSYHVVASNADGSTTSRTATVTVQTPSTPPQITAQPQSLAVTEGAQASFTVSAQGSALSYQWLRNGVELAGATGPVLTLGTTALADSGALLRCRVSNSAGSTTSDAALLTVTAQALAPGVLQPPADTTVAPGQSATFSVTASGSAPFSYQWLLNGVAIPNATAATYLTPAATLADHGTRYSVRISNAVGSITSGAATMNVSTSVGSIEGLHHSFGSVNGSLSQGILHAIPAEGGQAVALMPVDSNSIAAQFVQAEIQADTYSNPHLRQLLVWKNNRLYLQGLVGTSGGLPTATLVSTLGRAEVCSDNNLHINTDGNAYANAAQSWALFRKPGSDGVCATADDLFTAVRANMAATDAPVAIAQPMAAIRDTANAIVGWLVRNGQQIQRVDADFANPITLFTLPGGNLILSSSSAADVYHNVWFFMSGDGLYAWSLNSTSPSLPTRIATTTSTEMAFEARALDTDGIFLAITDYSAGGRTRVLRYMAANQSTIPIGAATGLHTLWLTPTRVLLKSSIPGGALWAFPRTGGTGTPIYQAPSDGTMPTRLYIAGERVWISLTSANATAPSVVSLDSQGSAIQTTPNAYLAGCFTKRSGSLSNAADACDAVLLVTNGSARSHDAVTTALRMAYGSVAVPSLPYLSQFALSPLCAWGQGCVLNQYIANTGVPNVVNSIHYHLKSTQPGTTVIALP